MEFIKGRTWGSVNPDIKEPKEEDITYYGIFNFEEYEIKNMPDSLKDKLTVGPIDEDLSISKPKRNCIRFLIDGNRTVFNEYVLNIFNDYLNGE